MVEPKIRIGDYVKARFWLGETIWAKVTAVSDGSIDATLANDPAPSSDRPEGWHNPLSIGDPVSCALDEVIEHIREQSNGA